MNRSKLSGLCAAACLTLSLSLVSASGASTSVKAHTAHSYIYGLNTYAAYGCQGPTVWSQDATNQVAAFKSLGANSIALVFPLYTASNTADAVTAKQDCAKHFYSPTPAQLAVVAGIAHSAGLRVFLRPVLDENSLKAQNILYWRGSIKPSNVSTWFANYLSTLTPYLQMAQTQHVENFAISTELTSMALKSNWASLISSARKMYSGSIIFTASWANGGNAVAKPGTTLGVDMYRPVPSATPVSTPLQLLAGWDSSLKTIPISKTMGTITIDEAGIVAQNDAYQSPSTWPFPVSAHPFNPTIQVNWLTMACSFMREHAMKGIYFYGPTLTDRNGSLLTSNNSLVTGDIQPNAQIAIKNCFGIGHAPVITSLNPSSGPAKGGTTVLIHGSNFEGAIEVSVSGSPASNLTVLNNGAITFVTPKHGAGSVQISVATEAGNSATFKYTFK